MATYRSRTALGSGATVSFGNTVPLAFVVGWVLLAAGEVLAPMGAPAAPLVVGVVAGILGGTEIGMITGFAVGLVADLLSGSPLGAQAGGGALFGALAGTLSDTLSQSSWVAPALLTAAAALPYRWVVGGLVRLGGQAAISRGVGEALWLVPWDVGAALVLYFVLSRWLAIR